MANKLLLEIGLEEMPAQYVTSSSQQLEDRIRQFLTASRIDFETIEQFSTPRRLAVVVSGLSESQPSTVEEVKGPSLAIAKDAEGNWTKAAEGFARSNGVDVSELTTQELKGVAYVYASKQTVGQPTFDVLSQLTTVIEQMVFPVSMRWGSQSLSYIRPIQWLVALYGDRVVPLEVAGVTSGRMTRGHRFLGNTIELLDASAYETALLQQFVNPSYNKRQAAIIEQLTALMNARQWQVVADADLLEEVTNLVEWPTIFVGAFDEKYLAIPHEVLQTSMKTHQRYFSVTDMNGDLLPHFIGVRNGNDEHLDTVVKGNEKVLTARLEDALFFYQEDQKLSIADAVTALQTVNVHQKIGTMTDKMSRVAQIGSLLAEQLGLMDEEQQDLQRAAHIYKFDLVTQLVNEFPELQGIMGEHYALQQGETPVVAQAIREHYLPVSSEGALPTSRVGAVLAVADKLDSLTSFFIQGMVPTGSNDPFALRRQAIGIVSIFEQFAWPLSLRDVYDTLLTDVYHQDTTDLSVTLTEFTLARLQQRLQAKGIRHDVVEAAINGNNHSLSTVAAYATELQTHIHDSNFKEVIEALTRVVNLGRKANDTEGFVRLRINEKLFNTNSELALFYAMQQLSTTVSPAERYADLVKLTPLITAFFNDNMVFVDEILVRNNRLNLLRSLSNVILTFADTSRIQAKSVS